MRCDGIKTFKVEGGGGVRHCRGSEEQQQMLAVDCQKELNIHRHQGVETVLTTTTQDWV